MALHWLTVLVLVALVSAIWSRELLDDKVWRTALLNVHRHLGLLIWLLLAARLLTRWRLPRVDASGPMPWPLRMAATLSHWTMYGLLLALPLAGWALTNAHGRPVQVLGLFTLPTLLDADPDLADLWEGRHVLLAWTLGALIGVHVAAALWHHFIRRDGLLRSILPARR